MKTLQIVENICIENTWITFVDLSRKWNQKVLIQRPYLVEETSEWWISLKEGERN